jgi:hypothetical protein
MVMPPKGALADPLAGVVTTKFAAVAQEIPLRDLRKINTRRKSALYTM